MDNALTIGIDEVGRGPWAGPLVAVAVCLSGDVEMDGLTDSKKLTPRKREQLLLDVRHQAHALGIGWAPPAFIDKHGLTTGTRKAMRSAWMQLPESNWHASVRIDGNTDYLSGVVSGVKCIPKGDQLEPAISAASIVAKVARDRFMQNCAEVFPGYGFESHVGYGTAEHKAALGQYGPCNLHRYSFSPVKRISGK